MQVKERVFILRAIRYGDADLILSCLTPTGSRLGLIARGAVKSKKRFGGGVLEPTHYVNIVYDDKVGSSGEARLHTLKEASLIESFDELRSEYGRIEAGLHFVRLVADVVREGDVHSADLFNLLGNALRAAQTSTKLDRLRIHFETKLLANQGVLPPDEEEDRLLRTPIAEHERISFDEAAWGRVRSRVNRVLRDYIDQSKTPRA
jgi:DNA repair protein RecO (recombination protein O)